MLLPTKLETALENNYALCNACSDTEIFSCSTCKLHEIKTRKHYFLMAHCIRHYLSSRLIAKSSTK